MQRFSTIIGVIELRQNGIPFKTIRSRYEIGSSTIALIMERFGELGLSLEELRTMNPQEVESKFYPEENRRDTSKARPDFHVIHEMMTKMKHPDLSFIWANYYKPQYPDGYQLTQFYKLYGEFLKENYGRESVKMPVERIPGEKMYIDWIGDHPACLTDPATGEMKDVHIFTTTMGFSSCVYAEIFPDEKLPQFITGVVHALEFYGAIPKYLVPDNLKRKPFSSQRIAFMRSALLPQNR